MATEKEENTAEKEENKAGKETKTEEVGGNTYNISGDYNEINRDRRDHDNVFLTLTGDELTPEQIEKLSVWLKKERKEKKITQKDMAKKTGIDLKYYQKLESAKIPIEPRITTLNKIVKGLGYKASTFQLKANLVM